MSFNEMIIGELLEIDDTTYTVCILNTCLRSL